MSSTQVRSARIASNAPANESRRLKASSMGSSQADQTHPAESQPSELVPMRQPILHQVAFIHLSRELLAICLHIVYSKMLHGRCNLQIVWVVALQSLDISNAHAPGQKRVLAEHFLDSSPTWIAAYVNHRR